MNTIESVLEDASENKLQEDLPEQIFPLWIMTVPYYSLNVVYSDVAGFLAHEVLH
jgi:hypothetical protein